MTSIPIEVVTIGFDDFERVDSAVTFINKYQDIFYFKSITHDNFVNYQPNNGYSFQTTEIYNLLSEKLSEIKGFHHLIIAIVENQLDGKNWDNLFGSMQTDDNDNLTGKAITTTYQTNELLKPIPIELYYVFEFLSFAIRFVVGKGLIHDNERGCIFHRKVNKADISEAIKAGYISLESQKKINNYLELNQIIQFKTVLTMVGDIARSAAPEKRFSEYLAQNEDETNKAEGEPIKEINIFISYAKEDFEKAKKVYEILRDKKYKPWIDKVDLLPGQNWEFEIKKAITYCDYFIACISNKSVSKEGFYQSELKKALQVLDNKPDDSIFLIPVRLEECPIPPRFEKIHYCDFFEEDGIEKLLRAIMKE